MSKAPRSAPARTATELSRTSSLASGPPPAPALPAADMPPEPDAGSRAGRGGLAVAGAKLWFIAVGFLQQTMLPRLIGLDGYGAFSVVSAAANIPNNVVVTGSIQGVSRGVAEAPRGGEIGVERKLLRIHAALAPIIAAPFLFAAPFVAEFEHAPHLTTGLRVFSIVLLAYALYAPMVGVLNGRRRFVAQAALDVTAASLRTIGLLGAAWLAARASTRSTAASVAACAAGMAAAALLMLPIASALLGRVRARSRNREEDAAPSPAAIVPAPPFRAHVALVLRLSVAQLFLNLLMQADITLLRRFAHESAVASGLAGDTLRARVDELVGSYRAAQLFAFLPYQLLIAVTFILFPMLARAHADRDERKVADYVRAGVRLSLILAGIMSASIAAVAPHLLRLAYPPAAAAEAGSTLRILALGQGAFALLGIESTVLASLSRERWSVYITALAVVMVATGCTLLVPAAGSFGPALLVRTALATSAGLAATATVGALLVRRTAGAFASASTLIRVPLAMLAAVFAGMHLPWLGRPMALVETAAMAGLMLAMLLLTRELGAADLALLRRTLAGRGARRGAPAG